MKNLRKRREARGLSRYELAKLADVSPETISQIERGAGSRIETAQRLARALHTTVGDLIGERAAAS
jgi:transcriptional regulator with XRE-family HTH domain